MKRPWTFYWVHACRLFLGGTFFLMGLNGFFDFITMPENNEQGKAFIDALNRMQYFWPLEKSLEVIFGVFLLANRFIPLAVDGLAAIIVNILLFHLCLEPQGLWLALAVALCELTLVISLWKQHFAAMFRP